MIRRLDDPRRVRALRRACRRAGTRRRWWRPSRRRSRSSSNGGWFSLLGRLLVVGVIAAAGVAVHREPLAAQLLALAGILLMHARIASVQTALGADANLASLAQLPIANQTVFDFQLRRRWQPLFWTTLDAAAFWAVAWAQRDVALLVWLLPVALTHALVTETMALLLLRRWPAGGLLLVIIIGTIVWGTLQHSRSPWLWSAVKPVLHAIAWLSPWGWLNTLALRLPGGMAGALLGVLGAFGAIGVAWTYRRARSTWQLHRLWRQVAGRPVQTWVAGDGDHDEEGDLAPELAPPVPSPAPAGDAAPSGAPLAASESDSGSRALAGLTLARTSPSGQCTLPFGWAGRRALALWNADERWIADRLGPLGTGPTQWRWALVLAGLPAVCAVARVTPQWAALALTLILLALRLRTNALVVAVALACTLIWPGLTRFVCVIFPCAIAVLMTTPVFGGSWLGLPMGSTALGSVPRSWSSMLRIMVTLTWHRFVAGIPILALAVLALGYGIERGVGATVFAIWIAAALFSPSLLALRLLQRTPGGVDLSLSRRLLTAAGTCCLLAQLTALVIMIVGANIAVKAGDTELGTLVMFGAGVALSLAATAIHSVLLRHAYRRRVDLIASL